MQTVNRLKTAISKYLIFFPRDYVTILFKKMCASLFFQKQTRIKVITAVFFM